MALDERLPAICPNLGTRGFLQQILGEGVLVAEGADHRRQRKIMNPLVSL